MKYPTFLIGFLLVASTAVSAAPAVTGNTISWPDDGWYQVQLVTDDAITEVCAGTRSCEVGNGNYIVINHTTGERFEGVLVNGDSSASGITVTGNTISWPNDGWYQVQALNGIETTEVCGGTRFCEVANGSYIVINHSTGQRYEDIVVSGEPPVSAINVTGNTIAWPNDGWYQVQAVTDEGITEVCAGTRLCEVSNGAYIVINHTTGERFEPILVNSDSTEPDPQVSSIIRAETWEDILRNVVALTNADRAVERHGIILARFASVTRSVIAETLAGDSSGALAALGLTMLPLADPDNNQVVDYSCDAGGGELNLNLNPSVPVYSIRANNCAIGGDVYDGEFFHNGVGREGFLSRIGNMSVTLADGAEYSLSGTHSTSFDRVGIRRSIQWADASTTDQAEGVDYSVDAFNIVSEAAKGPLLGEPSVSIVFADGTEGTARQYLQRAAVNGSFTVSAPWSDNRAMQVTSNLSLGGVFFVTEATPDLPVPYASPFGDVWPLAELNARSSQWTSGSLEVVAADGSRLSMRPMSDDSTRALVDVSSISGLQQVLLSDGFQVSCFGSASDFPNCQ